MSDPLEFEVFTLFPELIEAFAGSSLLGKAIERGLVEVYATDLRTFTSDRHRSVDDSPFGGGAGMVIKPGPVVDALESVAAKRGPMHRVLLTPSAPRFDQRAAERLARHPRLALLCGRYEGIDDRVREGWVDECLSLGDFVLNGGEVAAFAVIEAVARLREGFVGNPESIETESFSNSERRAEGTPAWELGLVLEHPHYTRPAQFRDRDVPPILLTGDHQRVDRWRRRVACLRTWSLRPGLRPKWSLAPDHPIYLAVPSDTEQLSALADSVNAARVELLVLGRAQGAKGPRLRDLKQARKDLRKRHGRDPWILGISTTQPGEPELGPRIGLDVLAYERAEPPAPLLLWFGPVEGSGASQPIAYLALHCGVSADRRTPLAIAGRMIDISQPREPVPPGSIASLAQTLLERMTAEGLLSPSEARPNQSESSP